MWRHHSPKRLHYNHNSFLFTIICRFLHNLCFSIKLITLVFPVNLLILLFPTTSQSLNDIISLCFMPQSFQNTLSSTLLFLFLQFCFLHKHCCFFVISLSTCSHSFPCTSTIIHALTSLIITTYILCSCHYVICTYIQFCSFVRVLP